MPVKFNSNNRVLNGNARATDVAKTTIDRILDVQTRRYQEAFRVQGYRAILYYPLTSGIPCACHGREVTVARLLDEDGKASPGLINELITGETFNVTPYGVVPSDVTGKRPASVPEETPLSDYDPEYEIDGRYARTNSDSEGFDDVFGVKANNKGGRSSGNPGPMTTFADVFSTTEEDPRARTIMPKDMNGTDHGGHNIGGDADDFESLLGDYPVDEDPRKLEGDLGAVATDNLIKRNLLSGGGMDALGFSDVACPVCFGSGYVGGYRLHNGWRHVQSIATNPTYLGASATDLSAEYPVVHNCSGIEFNVKLPRGGVDVDACRAFNNLAVIPASIFVDGLQVTNEYQVLKFCDGADHTFRVELPQPSDFTHFELQINQSREWLHVEFPRTSRSGNQELVDDTDPVSLNLPPMVPDLKVKCIIVESTYHKAFLVKSFSNWNDRRRRVLGWDCDVRVIQPAELWNLLPRRQSLEQPHRVSQVRDNKYGHRRT